MGSLGALCMCGTEELSLKIDIDWRNSHAFTIYMHCPLFRANSDEKLGGA